MMKQSNDLSLSVNREGENDGIAPFDYTEITDSHARAILQRCEERIAMDKREAISINFDMAEQFHLAKTTLAGTGKTGTGRLEGQWTRWVKGTGFPINTADTYARIGALSTVERDEFYRMLLDKNPRAGAFTLAAFVGVPEDYQEEIKSKIKGGEVKATATDILKAVKEAEEAKKRAQDAEYAARQAMAKLEERIEDVRKELDAQNKLAIADATARLQRDVDEARHQAELRKRDTDEAQRQVQRAQAEWDMRLKDATSKATEQERSRLEREYTKQMQDLEKQLEAQRQAARRAERDVNALTARLENARDSEAVRARWGMLAATMVKMLDGWLAEFPTAADAQYFEAHERTLTESVIKRLEVMLGRTNELSHSSTTIIDAR